MLFKFSLFSRVYYAITLLGLIILGGTVGYMFVEGYTVNEAFYMTIITVSTVGFSEIQPLSDAGRMFTSMLILSSFGTFVYAITSITTYLVGGEYRRYFKEYKVMSSIEKLSGHIVICGYGRVGTQAAEQLSVYKKNFVIIESDRDLIEKLRNEDPDFLIVEGNATEEEVFSKVGLERASALITALPSDADNLFVVLSAREINQDLTIISRASHNGSVKKLRMAGANNVIMPDKLGGAHMASLVVTPDVMEFLDLLSVTGQNEVNLEEISFEELPEKMHNKTLKELNESYDTGCSIIGYRNADGDYIINPGPEVKITTDCKFFVLGNKEQIKRLNNILGI